MVRYGRAVFAVNRDLAGQSPIMTENFTENVLPDLLAWRHAEGAGALVTLVRKSASGPRPLGSQLAVATDGQVAGLISGGCVEAGIAAEARAAMAKGRNRMVRFGEGSRYVDLRLPCGGAVDVYVDVTVTNKALAQVAGAMDARCPVVLVTDTEGGGSHLEEPGRGDDAIFATTELAWWDTTTFRRLYRPTPRLVLAGRGPIVAPCAHMATLNGYEVVVLTDDPPSSIGRGAEMLRLTRATVASVEIDPSTAVVSLFHDHEAERPMLHRALASPAFFIGALGSRTAHTARLADLREDGLDEAALARIEGPAGVPIHAATPAEIATSILAGVIRAYRARRPSVEAHAESMW
ncbi:xanthine dehydrogenase accessory factor [Rhodospira trueperi]|uniref:Xanthine dehydrogenase accessory factor n=2 Tax=Rhodospira trueperi TaxID=69960 RepID=A0A1G7BG46_9PROT|nr:xanthine dehydrogenase accessory factor [Rhodospira trueperi]